MLRNFRKLLRKSERGQAIILIAFAIVGLVAMVGLMTDTGLLLIEYGRLKRGIDAASISAALQFREGFTNADLENAAKEFLRLNQADVYDIQVDTCATDSTLCTTPVRKLVRVTASRYVQFGFLRVLGINQTSITAASVGEAASIDLVLVVDTSASMAYETNDDTDAGGPTYTSSDPTDDPSDCNPQPPLVPGGPPSVPGYCQPLEQIKAVINNPTGADLLDTMFFPYDRVAIITMTSQNADGNRNPAVLQPLTNDENLIRNAVDNLRVFQPPVCNTSFGPCLNYPDGVTYAGQECPLYRWGEDLTPNTGDEVLDPSSCTSSNIGGALILAGSEFARTPVRQDSFWVVITLAGGPANSSDAATGHIYGYCPPNTWNDTGDRDADGIVGSPAVPPDVESPDRNPFCRDAYSSTRHANGDAGYDADDYARDQADFLADPTTGQGVTIFTIGLGNLIRNSTKGDADAGEQLLTYIAQTAGGTSANHGQYYFAPDASGLAAIFTAIADNIFTRLSQ